MVSKKLKNPFDLLHPRFQKAAKRASQDLTRLNIKHVLIGGIAAGVYGRPRETDDIDFLLHQDACFREASPLRGSVSYLSRACGPCPTNRFASSFREIEETRLERSVRRVYFFFDFFFAFFMFFRLVTQPFFALRSASFSSSLRMYFFHAIVAPLSDFA